MAQFAGPSFSLYIRSLFPRVRYRMVHLRGIRLPVVLALLPAARAGLPQRLWSNPVSMRFSSPQGMVAPQPLDNHGAYVTLCSGGYRRT
jgi:hypothetical protein